MPDLKLFFNSLQDQPLEPDDPFYVSYFEAQADDPITAICQHIDWSEAATLQLLSGQRGCGKSTQLRRLKKILEEQGCLVFLCDLQDFLNLSMPVEIGDFLIAILASLSKEVASNTDLGDPARRGFFTRLEDFFRTQVKFEKFKLQPGGVGLEAALKDDPAFKRDLQLALRGHTAGLIKQAQEFVQVEIVQALRELTGNPDLKLVLLVDSVEKLRGDDEVHKSVETLFSVHGEHLRFIGLHTLYTVPPYLIPLVPGVGRNLGAMLRTLPNVHVRQRQGDDDAAGLAILTTMIEKRFAEWQQVIAEPELLEAARCTGGDLRDFFRLIRETLVVSPKGPGQLPIKPATLQSAKNTLQREMALLAQDDLAWLEKIAASKCPELPSNADLPKFARFFDTHLVLNYRNGDDWYDVHPLLKPLLDEYIARH